MNYSVPSLSIVFMAVAAFVGLAIPIALLLFFRKKRHADISPFWTGCAVFIVFVLVLENLVKFGFMQLGFWSAIQGNVWLFGIIGGLFAGVFEETGRFVAFKTVLRKKQGKDINALMYGAGHGGFEVVYLVCFSMVMNIIYAVMINSGQAELLTAGITDTAALQAMNATFGALSATPPGTFLISIVERVGAVALHISLSVLVWFATKNRKQFWLFPLALLLHALVDAVVGILASYISNLWLIEGVVYLFSAACIVLAVNVWKRNTRDALHAALDTGITPNH